MLRSENSGMYVLHKYQPFPVQHAIQYNAKNTKNY